jgi:arsenate reductase
MELWHNPSCSKSRAAKAILDDQGVTYVERRYVDHPPTVDELDQILSSLGREPWEVARMSEAAAVELGLASWPHERGRWLEAMVANPVLIERPLVETEKGVRLCRPQDKVREIL